MIPQSICTGYTAEEIVLLNMKCVVSLTDHLRSVAAVFGSLGLIRESD